MKSKRQTLYKSDFKNQLDDIVDYIQKDSSQSAIKFLEDIRPVIEKIIHHPEANPIVKQLPTKRNWYRYRLYKKRYKIIYKALKDKTVILGIINTSRNPEDIAKMKTSKYT